MVFFSWSKEESKKYAILTKEFFDKLFGINKLVWFSEESIESGTGFFENITRATEACDSIVLFLTKEIIYNPWIQFELGLFYSKPRCHIWPILFDGELYQNSTPFEHIQTLKAEKSVILKIVNEICNLYAKENFITYSNVLEQFDRNWENYWLHVQQVKKSFIDPDGVEIHDLMFSLKDNCQVMGREGNVFRFKNGFETHKLYDFILNNSRRRLWVFGRKNRKLFDRGNIEHFHHLGQKISTGFSLKCLFLDPSSEEAIIDHAQEKRNFKESLRVCIDDATEIIKESGFKSNKTMKLYKVIRNDAIIISDNIVYFENVKYKENMRPQHLTNTGFFVTSTDTCVGEYYVNVFHDAWDHAYLLGESDE